MPRNAEPIAKIILISVTGRSTCGSMLFWHRFDEALRCHSRDDSADFQISGIEQSLELGICSLASSVHHQHVQIEKLAERRRTRLGRSCQ